MSKSQTHVTNSRTSSKPTWRCVKSQPKEIKSKPYDEMITNLETDLAVVMFEKVKLQNDNILLNVELQECKSKLSILENKNAQNLESISKLQDDLKQTVCKLTDKDELFCETEKRYLSKISYLADAYNKEVESATTRENNLRTDIADLKVQLQKSEDNLKQLAEQLQKTKNRRNVYKERLKFCVGLITKLNKFFNEILHTKPNTDQHCQTEVKISDTKLPVCISSDCSLECENLVLSELFFKENPFIDSLEEIFFIQKDDCQEL